MKIAALPVAYEIRLFRYITADSLRPTGIFRPAIVNAVWRNREEGHDRGIDDSDETWSKRFVCFGGLDNTNTVSEMQLCINIRIVMWGRQFPFGQYIYIWFVRGDFRGYWWARIGKRKGLGRVGMCHRHEPTNRFNLSAMILVFATRGTIALYSRWHFYDIPHNDIRNLNIFCARIC